jgi:hypothetical protein
MLTLENSSVEQKTEQCGEGGSRGARWVEQREEAEGEPRRDAVVGEVDVEQCSGKRRESPGIRYGRGIAAKCSNACGICWSWNSAPRIFILQMQIYLQQLLEIV